MDTGSLNPYTPVQQPRGARQPPCPQQSHFKDTTCQFFVVATNESLLSQVATPQQFDWGGKVAATFKQHPQ